MGPSNSAPLAPNTQYTIIKIIPEQGMTFLQEKSTGEELLLKEFNTSTQQQLHRLEQLLRNRRLYTPHVNLLNIVDLHSRVQHNYCTNVYKLYMVIQYPFRTLSQQIQQRKLNHEHFQETELLSIIFSCAQALNHLSSQNLKHEALTSSRIYIQKGGIVKLVDPAVMGHASNIVSNGVRVTGHHVYLSPEQVLHIQNNNHLYDPAVSDVFTLAMIILEAMFLLWMDNLYVSGRLHISRLTQKIQSIDSLKYSNSFREIIAQMLQISPNNRISLPKLIDKIDNISMANGTTTTKDDKISIPEPTQHQTGERDTLTDKKMVGIPAKKPLVVGTPCKRTNQTKPSKNPTLEKPRSVAASAANYEHLTMTGKLQQTHKTDKSHSTLNIAPTINHSSHSLAYLSYLSGNFQETSFKLPSASNYLPCPSFHKPFDQLMLSTMIPPKSNYQHPPESAITGSSLLRSPMFQSNSVNLPTYAESFLQNSNPNALFYGHLSPSIINNLSVPKNSDPLFNNPVLSLQLNSYNIQQKPHSLPPPNFPVIPNDSRKPNFKQPLLQSPKAPHISPPISQPNSGSTFKDCINTPFPPNSTILEEESQEQHSLQKTPLASAKQQYIHQSSHPGKVEPVYCEEDYDFGSRYEGYKVDNMRHGHGRFYYQDGGYYQGQWKNNQMDGYAKLYYQSGEIAYEGYWKQDQFHGKGKVFNDCPTMLDRPFDYRNFNDLKEAWLYYDGDFVKDCRTGKGTIKLSNGQMFQGQFLNDMVDGTGIFYTLETDAVEGRWEKNKLVQIFAKTDA